MSASDFFNDFSVGMGLVLTNYFGVTFTWTAVNTGVQISCLGSFNSIDETQRLMLGGLDPGTAGTLVVRIVDMALPQIGDLITLNSESMRIASIDKDEVSYTLTLQNVAK